ncbi:enoyl-ACP reductase FabI [Candidatus Desulfovibrio trichonymphae]|uniref:Enoyl-[acyl-carrier-protein] reductase [NADH] n=1 Tax=Candidatus Desulfovibrio trichonymphae TaxID=1725232 RepID=A0A1J1DQL0_9BACT|nr:enoyl-ACP reductase [Candidatus Desulfovibrio trichonymphae]BAV92098.1 NADH-dependent enoyl-[acyl-carrier-protein] reductase [Candidatus Desulfovibrio trichonymphae]GHU91920.1 enoyl-[acyl-carrier-protein] reductase [NADH] [Deltaproteobacteria bacterium]GHU94649.1 enoyl-[acyl-carrier-protein] reductase [NADH] [Deltaproteobacteria bacterium]GHU99798.1 enoyl-[acyl-carrier-protein] reductase [NADH] [Deltaproteobacteria bacterium]
MLLQGKKALIIGLANNKSIAWGIASCFKAQGARLAFNYVGDAIKKRVDPLNEKIGGEFTFPCDVCDDAQIEAAVKTVKQQWGTVDVLVHSVAFANRDDLTGRYLNVSRDGFKLALEVSVYSLTALCRAFEPLLHDGVSVISMTYHGSTKIIPGYNVMGVAKAALEASVRYLALDLGKNGVRVNAISAGPIKTLASSAVSGLKNIFTRVEEAAPLHRNVTTTDVGGVATFLASDLAHGVTGEIVYVDSGFSKLGI